MTGSATSADAGAISTGASSTVRSVHSSSRMITSSAATSNRSVAPGDVGSGWVHDAASQTSKKRGVVISAA
jgi:hypothetical protein